MQSPLRASDTLTNYYLFYIAVSRYFLLLFSQLIRLLSKVMLFWVYYIWYGIGGNTSRMWAQIFQWFLVTKLWISSAVLSNSTCLMLGRLAIVFNCATLVFTSLLFFFRTRAVFESNPWVTAFFAGLCLAVLGGCLAIIAYAFEPAPVNLVSNVATTIEGCLRSNRGVDSYAAEITIIPLIYDTLVFLAITWRLSCNSYDPCTLKSGLKILIFGNHLPLFSKAFLRDGQAYYLLALPDLCLIPKLLTGVVISSGPSLPWIPYQWSCYSILRTLRLFD